MGGGQTETERVYAEQYGRTAEYIERLLALLESRDRELKLAWAEYNRAEQDAAAAEARPTFEHMEVVAKLSALRAAVDIVLDHSYDISRRDAWRNAIAILKNARG